MSEQRYGWVLVALGALMTCVAVGAMFSLAVFLQPMTEATGNFAFVAGILPGFVAFLAYGEWHVFDRRRRRLRRRPVGWDLANYQPGRLVPAEGWNELQGYYQGRRRVAD